MSVNLVKGQKVELKKNNGNALRKVIVGLGWDEAQPKSSGGFLSALFNSTQAIDCDATALICTNGRISDSRDIVYFGNLSHYSGAVKHMGDNLTGEGEGDDEQIVVSLDRVPESCDKIVFVVNIYQASQRRQHFGMIENAFIRICDAETNQELCKYNLSENYEGMTAMIFGEMYKHNGFWKFNAIGRATKDNDIGSLAARYQ